MTKTTITFLFMLLFILLPNLSFAETNSRLSLNKTLFENYFNLFPNNDDVDAYVHKNLDLITNFEKQQLKELIDGDNDNMQKDRAFLMLTVLKLNKQITEIHVSKDYYTVYYYDKKQHIQVSILLY